MSPLFAAFAFAGPRWGRSWADRRGDFQSPRGSGGRKTPTPFLAGFRRAGAGGGAPNAILRCSVKRGVVSSNSTVKGAHDCLGVAGDNRQQDARRAVGDPSALFPVLNRTGVQSESIGRPVRIDRQTSGGLVSCVCAAQQCAPQPDPRRFGKEAAFHHACGQVPLPKPLPPRVPLGCAESSSVFLLQFRLRFFMSDQEAIGVSRTSCFAGLQKRRTGSGGTEQRHGSGERDHGHQHGRGSAVLRRAGHGGG